MAELTREDVQQILDILDKSDYDYLQLEMGELKLTVSKSGLPLDGGPSRSVGGASAPVVATNAVVTPAAASPAPAAPAPAAPAVAAVAAPSSAASATARAEAAAREGLAVVNAPMVGTYYAQPEPGAPPFVQVGSKVDEDTTLGLIEVMKVFNSIRSGVKGTVAEILVQNAQFVEFGQPLFLIKPE